MPPYGAPDPRRYCRFDRRRRLLLVRFEKQLIGEAVAAAHLLPPWTWVLGDPGDNASHHGALQQTNHEMNEA